MKKRKQHSEDQIIKALKRQEAGEAVKIICREIGIHETTFYNWKQKFGGMELSEAKRMRAVEEENRRLKRIVADQALDIQMLKDINSKKW